MGERCLTSGPAVKAAMAFALVCAFTLCMSAASAAGDIKPTPCTAERGAAAAQRLATMCRAASPATHPPCNAANSCAMIQDEIARSCSLFADDHPLPARLCQPAPRSSAAAAAVVSLYYSALNARDYDTAWSQWGANGIPRQTLNTFAKGFSRTRATHVTIGALPPSEGAAGSIYQDVPVRVDAVLADGTRQHFVGMYQLRRVNGVDGATADQRRWHIYAAHLKSMR